MSRTIVCCLTTTTTRYNHHHHPPFPAGLMHTAHLAELPQHICQAAKHWLSDHHHLAPRLLKWLNDLEHTGVLHL